MSRSFVKQAGGYFAVWLVLIGVDPFHVPIGLAAAAAATAVSFRLRPAKTQRFRLVPMVAIAVRLAGQAAWAGVDVAWRALAPVPAVRPGLVSHRLQLPPGPARDTFCALMSLLPGTVPAGLGAGDELLVHCLDLDVPVAAQLSADEKRFLAALDERSLA